MSNDEAVKNKSKDYYSWLKMRIWCIILIFFAYFLAMIYSIRIIFELYSQVKSPTFEILRFTTFFCVLSCILYYVRKMYKHLIRGEMTILTYQSISSEEIGSVAYFLFRPFMSIAFGIITFFIMEVFFRLTISNGEGYSIGYIHLVAIIEFLGGFSVGRFVENLELVAKKVVDNLFKKVGE